MRKRKFMAALMACVMLVSAVILTGCKDKDEGADLNTEYAGILTKIKLGMPLTKIVGLQRSGVDLYYETDLIIWAVDDDIDLMEAASLIPEEKALFYYVENPIITYKFRTQKGDTEIYLNAYSEEIHGILDREAGEKYFQDKAKQLSQKHKADAVGSMTGTVDVDMTLTYFMKYDLPSYTITFTMIENFMTVDDVDGYYVTDYSIEIAEKAVKEPVSAAGVTVETEKG